MMKENKALFFKTLPLNIIILIDAMSFAVVAPVLASAMIAPATSVMMQGSSSEVRQLTYGFAIAISALMALFAAPVLGILSDRVGRRNVLLISSAGLFLGNILVGASIALSSLLALFIGRALLGATAANQATAQAAVVDMSPQKFRAFNLSLTLLFSSIGFILGPALGGYLSNHAINSFFNYPLPFYAISGLSIINLVFLLIFFNDTNTQTTATAGPGVDLARGLKNIFSVFREKNLRIISISFLLMQMGWGCFFAFVSVFLIDKHHFPPHKVANFMSILGAGFCISYGAILPFITKFFKLENICSMGLLLTASLILAFMCVPGDSLLLWAFPLPIAISVCFAYGTIITLFSNNAGDDRQGWIMGTTTSIVAMAWFASSFIAGFIEAWSVNGNMIFTALLMLGSLAFFSATRKPAAE